MATITDLADEYWTLLKHHEPYYAVLAGEQPGSIEPMNETTGGAQSTESRKLLQRLTETEPAPGEADLAAVLQALLVRSWSLISTTSRTLSPPVTGPGTCGKVSISTANPVTEG